MPFRAKLKLFGPTSVMKQNLEVITLFSLLSAAKETQPGRRDFFAIKIGPLPMPAKVHH